MRKDFHFFPAADGLKIRYGKWSPDAGDPAGSIVYLSGRAEFMEKNKEAFQRLCRRGYEVFTFDWRGQGLSERMLEDRQKGYVRSYEDFLSDLDLFVRRIFLPRTAPPRIVIGHSMGGHVALRYLHDHPGVLDKAVLVSPMFDIHTFPVPRCIVVRLTRAAVKAGLQARYIPGAGAYRQRRRFLFNPLTSDPVRFWDEVSEIRKNPDLALGGVTYGWLAASFDSIDTIHGPGYAEAIQTPVLLVSGTRERVVSRRAHKRFCSRLPRCRFLEIPGARHEILKETDARQAVFWKAFDDFAAG